MLVIGEPVPKTNEPHALLENSAYMHVCKMLSIICLGTFRLNWILARKRPPLNKQGYQ